MFACGWRSHIAGSDYSYWWRLQLLGGRREGGKEGGRQEAREAEREGEGKEGRGEGRDGGRRSRWGEGGEGFTLKRRLGWWVGEDLQAGLVGVWVGGWVRFCGVGGKDQEGEVFVNGEGLGGGSL